MGQIAIFAAVPGLGNSDLNYNADSQCPVYIQYPYIPFMGVQ